MTVNPVNLLGLPRADLEQLFTEMGEKTFRARQMMQWMYARSVLRLDDMTDLSKTLRHTLGDRVEFGLPEVQERHQAVDGVIKWQLKAGDSQAIETVFIPEEGRGTLCVSAQVGCAMDCPFCATGRQGFNRNLSAAEIVGQVMLARQELDSVAGPRISNVVFMGMGEPLANLRAVVKAVDILLDDFGFGLSRRRVTVSTSGLVPQLRKLGAASNVALAVSLHAPDDVLRDVLVPINRRHPIAELLEACWNYARTANLKDVTFEYVMLAGVNDSTEQARKLARLLVNRPAKVNLIPFNPFPGSDFARSSQAVVNQFRQILLDAGIMTVTRKTRGDDIAAACGQLAGQVSNRVCVPLGRKMQQDLLQ
ncbi:MAG TPA: 23S rRNA (adenine(2503)-C(2))-methyltransferase RlmN [Gammaproteobacteria bacterium]|jgi:23S rRNA (adenine2503-C2)-methyltransferase|nr:23S rRNA (adenine(2503)-C(2))-methyltransferase RlmN [Gammaproteobacteria bacterium]MDP7153695.1 23S rRNA (adenine(2503)-C(2))-methyltransferase RlmN [Gammaproteobacteria bacterium]MDP7660692.1 23S rRNA (adenine(2503)-C(2))-methyltransferase RlmN [Gammaproteobacteria bacterium]HJP39048.1 23S rRNA (adenine(2503)-C(2))-methyltransferase RlmN [Gammaproteobacteria bacterium]